MLKFNSIAGQSIWDVCLNTYGTLDNMVKLLQDNDIDNHSHYRMEPWTMQNMWSWSGT